MVGRVLGALTHPSPARRAVVATAIALGLWLAAWTVSYLVVAEGALRAVMAGAMVLPAWTAAVEAAGVAAFLQ